MSAPNPIPRRPRPSRPPAGRDRLAFRVDAAGKWRWQLKSSNGKVIDASSQGFTRKWSARRNALVTTGRLLAALID